MKIVISDPKKGKSYQKEIDKETEARFYGKKIGDVFNGELIDLQGYQFKITGGSDKSGFPMRPEIRGRKRHKLLLTKGVGMQANRKGLRKKKSVRGHTIGDDVAQVNSKIEKYGTANLDEVFKKEEKAEEKK